MMPGVPFCTVCQKYFNSSEQLSAHEKGQSHLAKQKTNEDQRRMGLDDDSKNADLVIKVSDYHVETINAPSQTQEAIPLRSTLNDISKSETKNKSLRKEADCRIGASNYSNQIREGHGQEYFVDEITKKGRCYICNIELSSLRQTQDHLDSNGHQKKRASLGQTLATSGLPPTAIQGAAAFTPGFPQDFGRNSPNSKQSIIPDAHGSDSNSILMCKICNAPFSSVFNMQQHFAGAKHKKEMRKREMNENLLERQNFDKYDPEQTMKKEFFQPGAFVNDSSSIDKTSALISQPQPTLGSFTTPETRLSSPFQVREDSIVIETSMQIARDGNAKNIKRSLSNNLTDFNEKVTPLKDKQVDLPSVDTNSQPGFPTSPTMSSIVENNQQPSFPASNAVPSPTGFNHGIHNRNQTLQGRSNTLPITSPQNVLFPTTSTPIQRKENTGYACNPNVSSVNASSPLNLKDKEYDFDGQRGFCHVCNVSLTSLKLAQQHLNGSQHRKKSEGWAGMRGVQQSQDIYTGSNTASSVGNTPSTPNNNNNTYTERPGLSDHSGHLSSSSISSRSSKSQTQNYYHFDGNKGFCRACNSELSSYSQASQHLTGKPHKRNVQRLIAIEQGTQYPLFCDVCKKQFTGQESAFQHFSSEKHERNEALLKSDTTQVLEIFEDGKKYCKNGVIWYFCDVCSKVLNNLEQLNIHRRSHNLAAIESPRNSPRIRQNSDDVSKTYGAIGYQYQGTEGGELEQNRYSSPGFPPSRQKSTRSSIDSQVSMEEIRELLRYGENPIVNTAFQPTLRTESANSVPIQQVVTNSETPFRSGVPGQLESSRLIRGRTDIGGCAFNNYNQSGSNSQDNLLVRGGDRVRFSSCQMSPEANENEFGFRPITPSTSSGGRSGNGIEIAKINNSNNENINNNGSHVRRSDTTATTTDNTLRHTGDTTNNPAENDNLQDNEGLPRGSILNDEVRKAFFGNVMTGVKPSNSRSSNSNRGVRSIMSLNQVEKEDSSDDDDDDNDTCMNIQGEECRSGPMTETSQQTLKNPPSSGARSGIRNKYYCALCDKQMNANKSFKDHLVGKFHQWKLSGSKVPLQLRASISKSITMQQSDYKRAFEVTKNFPRSYQVKLMEKAMSSDCVVYLPTGTGKTMVSVLTIGLMLEKNPQRPVIFLVDKVLLVIQQARYIKIEFEGKKFKRASSLQRNNDDDSSVEIVDREVTLAFVCRGLLCSNNMPIWQNDIIVTTVDYCINMLKNGSILWEDFSLAVLDEVHHCVKKHPYRRLIQDFHLNIENPRARPKVLGLSASPAGKSSQEATFIMLQTLLKELGGAKIAFVGEDCQTELMGYQSNPLLHPICVPLTDKEQHFQTQCIKYFLRCYMKLAPLSTTLRNNREAPCSYFYHVQEGANEETVQGVTNLLLNDAAPLTEILPLILSAACVKDAGEREKCVYESLRSHTFKVLLHHADIPTGVDFDELKADFKDGENNHVLSDVKSLGLPCDTFYKQILTFEEVEGNCETAMVGRLIQILQDPSYINWSKKDSMALVLVRERKNARLISRKLKHKPFVCNNTLRVTHLVGHGKGAQDGGMAVKDQKKVLDNQEKYDILVATSIAEEGVDINKLELVISMNPPTNVTALVQMRGRARKKGSHFVILCSNEEEMKRLEDLQQQEKNMLEAAKMCAQHQQTGV